MSDELSKPRINVDVDGEDVLVTFSWSCARLERPVYTGRADGNASIGLTKEDARELQLLLDLALDGQTALPPERVQEVNDAVAQQLQDFADAGHPDPEAAAAEAEARGDPAEEPSDDIDHPRHEEPVLKCGPGNVDEIITSHIGAHLKAEHRGSRA